MKFLNKVVPCFAVLVVPTIVIILMFVYGDYNKNPVEHDGPGSLFEVKMGAMSTPKHPFLRRDPYSIHIPKPLKVYGTTKETFWNSLFSVQKLANTAITDARWPEEGETTCVLQQNGTLQYTDQEMATFRQRIKNGFRLNFYVDNMPVVSDYEDGLWYGIDIGFLGENQQDVYLYTHYDFHIATDVYGRTMRVVAEPRHTDPSAPCGEEYAQPTRSVSHVFWSYRVFVRKINTKYEDRWKFYSESLHGQHSKIEKAALIYCGLVAFGFLVVLGILIYRNSQRKYDLEGFLLTSAATMAATKIYQDESSSGGYEDIEMEISDPQACLIDSDNPLQVTSERRTTSHQTTFTAEDINRLGSSTQSYLKNASHVILGSPRNPLAFASLIGMGVHLLMVTVLGLLLSSLVQHSWNNAWQTVTVLLMPLTGFVAGFQAMRTIQLYQAKNILCASILMLPNAAALFFIFFLVNSIELQHHDAAVVTGMFFFCLMMLVVYFVSLLGGMWLSSKFEVAQFREKSRKVYLPPVQSNCRWITQFILTTTVTSAFIGIGVVYVTLRIVQSIWANHVIVMILVILVFISFWVLITACVSILVAHFHVVYLRNPYWHWKTYVTAGGPAVVALLCGLIYAFTTQQDIDVGTQFLIFLIISFASMMMFMVLGAVGVISVDTYFRRCLFHFVTVRD